MSYYAEHKTNRKNWGIDVLGTVICIVELENGIQGVRRGNAYEIHVL